MSTHENDPLQLVDDMASLYSQLQSDVSVVMQPWVTEPAEIVLMPDYGSIQGGIKEVPYPAIEQLGEMARYITEHGGAAFGVAETVKAYFSVSGYTTRSTALLRGFLEDAAATESLNLLTGTIENYRESDFARQLLLLIQEPLPSFEHIFIHGQYYRRAPSREIYDLASLRKGIGHTALNDIWRASGGRKERRRALKQITEVASLPSVIVQLVNDEKNNVTTDGWLDTSSM